jgi:predicted HicB family RNase H-like nuclease
MPNYSSSIAWSPSDTAFVAVSPEFPGLSGLGPTPAEAVNELGVAIELALEEYKATGEQPPQPLNVGEFSGQFRLRLPKSLHQALAQRAGAEAVSLNSLAVTFLARGLGRTESQLQCVRDYRLLLGDWQLAFDSILAAMVRVDPASETTEYAAGYQDPVLRGLYRDVPAEPMKH